MKNIIELNKFIWEVDDTPQIAQYGVNVDGIFFSYWMLVRFHVSDLLLTHLGFGVTVDSIEPISLRKIKVIDSFRHRLRVSQADVLFLSPSVGNIHCKDGYVENIYHDAYINAFMEQGKKVLILEQTEFWQSFKKRRITTEAYSLTWTNLIRKAKEYLFGHIHSTAAKDIDRFIVSLDKILASYLSERNPILTKIKIYLIEMVKSLKFRIAMWESIISNVKPKIMVMQDVCYGGAMGVISLILKKHCITVIEDQHGAIDKDHIAYSYSNKILKDSLFTSHFPDFFLAYGSKWLESINIPMQSLPVGNFYLNQAKQMLKGKKPSFDLLVLADSERPYSTESKLKLLLKNTLRLALVKP